MSIILMSRSVMMLLVRVKLNIVARKHGFHGTMSNTRLRKIHMTMIDCERLAFVLLSGHRGAACRPILQHYAPDISLRGQRLKNVDQFKYLRTQFTSRPTEKKASQRKTRKNTPELRRKQASRVRISTTAFPKLPGRSIVMQHACTA